MKRKDTDQKTDKGQSLVEFAFGLVFMLILLAGIVDASRAFLMYMAMRDAAQEGALYASVNPSDNIGIENRVRDASNTLNGLGTNLKITITPTVGGKLCAGTTASKSHAIKVQVVYAQFPLTMPFLGELIGAGNQTVAISSEALDTILIPKCQ